MKWVWIFRASNKYRLIWSKKIDAGYIELKPNEWFVSNFQVEVKLKKKDIRKKASEFFENEAELSESEWGSADEDEKDNDHYEAELGDLDKFDKNKLRGELERIRLYVI